MHAQVHLQLGLMGTELEAALDSLRGAVAGASTTARPFEECQTRKIPARLQDAGLYMQDCNAGFLC